MRTRVPWWAELLLLVVVWAFYTLARVAVTDDIGTATHNARHVLDVERLLHLDVELSVSRWVDGTPWVAAILCYAYASLHYVVTVSVLLWARRFRPTIYPLARDTLIVATFIALFFYWQFPVAPPRLSGGGFIDVMADYAHLGWWGGNASAPPGTGGMTNEFAAFPSMHVGWAFWCGAVLLGAGTPLLRSLGAAYPLFACLVVVGTGNHFLLDALAGVATVLVAAVIAGLWHRDRLRLLRDPEVARSTAQAIESSR